MPEDKEVLGFELEFLADNNELEKIQKLLRKTNGNVKKLKNSIGLLNQEWGRWKGHSTRSKDPIKKEEWLKKANALKKVTDELDNAKNPRKIYKKIVSFVPGSIKNKIAKEKVDNINVANIIDKKFQNVIKDKNLKNTTTKFSKNSDKPIERKTYQTKTKERGKIYTRNVVTEGENIISSNETINKGLGKGGVASKFLSRVKNIVIYRLVRVAMSAITKGINEGFQLLSSSNSAYKDVITDLKSATTALSVSFATMLLPIAEMLTSTLSSLSSVLLNNVNAMALQNAQAQGQSTYFKLSQEAIDDYAKSLQNANKSLSQLDKFATLSQNKPILGKFVEITDEEVKNVKDVKTNFQGVNGVLKDILGVFVLISSVVEFINSLSETLKQSIGMGVYLAVIAVVSAVMLLNKQFSPIKGGLIILSALFLALGKIITSEIHPALKWISGILITIAAVAAFIVGLIPGGKVRITTALIGAGAAVAGLGAFAIGQSIAEKNVDTGASQASYDSPLASGASEYSSNEPVYNEYQSGRKAQVSTSTSDVYLDGNKVGKTLTKTVFSYGAKGGYL